MRIVIEEIGNHVVTWRDFDGPSVRHNTFLKEFLLLLDDQKNTWVFRRPYDFSVIRPEDFGREPLVDI